MPSGPLEEGRGPFDGPVVAPHFEALGRVGEGVRIWSRVAPAPLWGVRDRTFWPEERVADGGLPSEVKSANLLRPRD